MEELTSLAFMEIIIMQTINYQQIWQKGKVYI